VFGWFGELGFLTPHPVIVVFNPGVGSECAHEGKWAGHVVLLYNSRGGLTSIKAISQSSVIEL
jgi:hypothetical protein